MNFFNKKRGFGKKAQIEHEFYYIIAQMLLIVLIALSLFSFVGNVLENTLYEKNYLSKDIALIVDTIYSAPGDISYIYSGDTMGFIIDFKPNNVFVYEELEMYEKLPYPQGNYPFLEDNKVVFGYDAVSPELDMQLEYEGVRLKIDKLGEKITVGKVEK